MLFGPISALDAKIWSGIAKRITIGRIPFREASPLFTTESFNPKNSPLFFRFKSDVRLVGSEHVEGTLSQNPIFEMASNNNSQGGGKLARSNYNFKKRQKELKRMKKQEEKRQRKLDKKNAELEENSTQPPDEGEDDTSSEPED